MADNSFYKNQYIAFIADKIDVKVHRHLTLQIVISLDNSFSSFVSHTMINNIQIILINKFVPHSCFTSNSKVLIYLIEPQSYLGSIIKFTHQNQDYITLECDEQIKALIKIGNKCNFSEQLLFDKFLNHLFLNSNTNIDSIDNRITVSIDFIKRHIHQDIDLTKTANYINLSESRFRHLFNEQIGMPFSKYVLWTRIKMVFINTAKYKMNFTEAALSAGFSDQAHFNNVFSKAFGISPGGLVKNSRFIQVYL